MKQYRTVDMRLRRLSRVSVLIAVGIVAGCADLAAVREFAKTSAATADYAQIVNDYAQQPIRRIRYQRPQDEVALRAEATTRENQKKSLIAAQTVLVEYMSALGDLAADELPNVDKEIDAIGKELEKQKFVGTADAAVSKETATAASTIAKVLTRAVLDHWRQAKVVELITAADPHVQTLVEGLSEIVRVEFDASLNLESQVLTTFFRAPIADAMSRGQPESVPRLLSLERQEVVAARRAKLIPYADVLGKIAKGHSDLRQNVGELDRKDLKDRLKQYSKDLKTLRKAIADLS